MRLYIKRQCSGNSVKKLHPVETCIRIYCFSSSFLELGTTWYSVIIFSKADTTLNGTGTLEIVSSKGNGISSKDELKITGGVYNINSSLDAIEANDAILVYDGTVTIDTGKDALNSENEEDASLGYIYIKNGTLNITAADDAIRGNSIVQIDGGTINIKNCEEGIEATNIKLNGGQITLYAKNDGINASPKSSNNPVIEVNGGKNGGNVTVNGEKITQITQSQMGGKESVNSSGDLWMHLRRGVRNIKRI